MKLPSQHENDTIGPDESKSSEEKALELQSLTSMEKTSTEEEEEETGKFSNTMRPLAEDFQPGDDDVICGRGKKCYNHSGNERFRAIVEGKMEEYSAATSKLDKSLLLSSIVAEVREKSPGGGFVRKDPSTGKWFEIGDFLAREKTSQAFRDALHESYRSSNKAKRKRRLEEQNQSSYHLQGQFHFASEKLSFGAERSEGSAQQLLQAMGRPDFNPLWHGMNSTRTVHGASPWGAPMLRGAGMSQFKSDPCMSANNVNFQSRRSSAPSSMMITSVNSLPALAIPDNSQCNMDMETMGNASWPKLPSCGPMMVTPEPREKDVVDLRQMQANGIATADFVSSLATAINYHGQEHSNPFEPEPISADAPQDFDHLFDD